MTLSTGSRIGVYEVVAPLGAGGMGEVYRAHDTRLGRDVAIKLLPASLAADPDRLARLEREARLLATLNHPNIAAIYGVEDGGGMTALVLELVEGETLAAALERQSGMRVPGLGVPQALAVKGSEPIEIAPPVRLFHGCGGSPATGPSSIGQRWFEVAADGSRFLLACAAGGAPSPIVVSVDWTASIK